MDYLGELRLLGPELMLTAAILVVLAADIATGGKQSTKIGWLAIIGLICTGVFVGFLYNDKPATVFGMVTIDQFGLFFKMFVIASLIVVILFAQNSNEIAKSGTGEFYFILCCAGLGAMFLVSTYNLLLLYLSLELLGISSYVLSGFLKGNRKSGEASIKYVVFGALASGLMLYGISLIYGLTGSLDIHALGNYIQLKGADAAVGIAVTLSLIGFAYKISAVPMHFWTPDVYEGAPTPVTTFLAVASKGVAFGALIRFLEAGFLGSDAEASRLFAQRVGQFLGLLAAVSMTFGNLAALRQTSLKRLLAYSSIAHAGYILVGLSVMWVGRGEVTQDGFQSAMFYLLAYYLMNLGAFGCVTYFANQTGQDNIESIRGLGWKAPLVGACFVAFLLSLTGVPPTVGFFGKYYLLLGAWKGGMWWLALFVALNSVISLFYYFRIAKALYLATDTEPRYKIGPAPMLTSLLVLFGIGTLLFGLWATPLQQLCQSAAIK